MASHLAPKPDRHRLLGALSVALGITLLTIGALGFGARGGDDDGVPPLDKTTDPTVLGVEITRPPDTTAGDVAPAAVPATFPPETTAGSGAGGRSTRSGTSSSRPRQSTTTTTQGLDIGTPTSVTAPPTTRPATTTTLPDDTTTTSTLTVP